MTSTISSPIAVPDTAALYALREEGAAIGYRGIAIYLRYQAILETVRGVQARRALVIGAGYGMFDRLLPADLALVGIDVAVDDIRFASAWAAEHRPTWVYRAERLEACGFDTAEFDLVFLSEIIEHIPADELPALFAELDRVLTPGGRLLLTVPNHLHLRNRARRLVRKPTVLMDQTHLREYTLDEANAVVRDLPYELLEFRPAVLYFPFEAQVARLVPPHGSLRRAIIARVPSIASHFIYLLRKPEDRAI